MSEYLPTAVGFAGQGSQDVKKMQQTLLSDSKYLKAMAEAAREQGISEDLVSVLRNAESGEDLALTGYNQLLVSAHGLELFDQMLQQRKLTCQQIIAAFGLSIGELPARHVAGEISLKDLAGVIAVRAKSMADVFVDQKEASAQYAVMGNVRAPEIARILAKYPGRVWIGNRNSPSQIVIAGYSKEVAEAAQEITAFPRAKVVKLNTAGAFHTPILQPAAEKLAEKLGEIEFRPANLIVSPNFEGDKESEDVRQSLISQVINPVQLSQNIKLLKKRGVKSAITFDAKGFLAKIVAANSPALAYQTHNISCPEDVANFDPSMLRAKEKIIVPGARELFQQTRSKIYLVASEMVTPLGLLKETMQRMAEGETAFQKLSPDDIQLLVETKGRYFISRNELSVDLDSADFSKIFLSDSELDTEQREKLESEPSACFFRLNLTKEDFELLNNKDSKKLKLSWEEHNREDRYAFFEKNFPTKIGGIISKEFLNSLLKEVEQILGKNIFKELKKGIDTSVIWHILAVVLLALKDAGMLNENGQLKDEFRDTATFVGTGTGGSDVIEKSAFLLGTTGKKSATPPKKFFPSILSVMLASYIANTVKAQGPQATVDTACASGLAAIHYGVNHLLAENGIVITGGADIYAQLATAVKGFAEMTATAKDSTAPEVVPQPFGSDPSGFIGSDGAAANILATEEFAKEFALPILCEIYVTGSSCTPLQEGKAITAGTVEGQTKSVQKVLVKAGMQPQEIDLVIAHGTGTPVGDPIEADVLNEIFGVDKVPPVFAPKAQIGHGLGGATAESVALSVGIFQNNLVPANLNYEINPDIGVPVITEPTEFKGKNILVMGYGFGGGNYAAVMVRCEDTAQFQKKEI